MFGVFLQDAQGLRWVGNEATLGEAKKVCEDYRESGDFAIVLRVEYLADFDGEREYAE